MPPEQAALEIARRMRANRAVRGWSREELAARAGVAVDTLRVFERTGRIAFVRLLQLAVALDLLRDLHELFAPPPVTTIADLEREARVKDARQVAHPRARRRRTPG